MFLTQESHVFNQLPGTVAGSPAGWEEFQTHHNFSLPANLSLECWSLASVKHTLKCRGGSLLAPLHRRPPPRGTRLLVTSASRLVVPSPLDGASLNFSVPFFLLQFRRYHVIERFAGCLSPRWAARPPKAGTVPPGRGLGPLLLCLGSAREPSAWCRPS